MVLGPCRECGEKVPQYAKICPHCEIRNPVTTQKERLEHRLSMIFYVIAPVGVAVIVFFIYRQEPFTVRSMDTGPKATPDSPSRSSPTQTTEASRLPEYRLIRTEDTSYGRVIRQAVRIRVPKHYTKGEVERIARAVTSDITSRQDVNAVMMYFHGPDATTSGIPDVARVEWAPYGNWGSADRVQAGDYPSFQYTVHYNPPVAAPAPTAITLTRSTERGLLGAPLPVGAHLIKRTEGNPSEYRDPTEQYQIDATAGQIIEFYRKEMVKLGWRISPPSAETALFFEKGNLMLGVLTNKDGGTFTLMG